MHRVSVRTLPVTRMWQGVFPRKFRKFNNDNAEELQDMGTN